MSTRIEVHFDQKGEPVVANVSGAGGNFCVKNREPEVHEAKIHTDVLGYKVVGSADAKTLYLPVPTGGLGKNVFLSSVMSMIDDRNSGWNNLENFKDIHTWDGGFWFGYNADRLGGAGEDANYVVEVEIVNGVASSCSFSYSSNFPSVPVKLCNCKPISKSLRMYGVLSNDGRNCVVIPYDCQSRQQSRQLRVMILTASHAARLLIKNSGSWGALARLGAHKCEGN